VRITGPSAEDLTPGRFGGPTAVDVGGVEEVDADVEGGVGAPADLVEADAAGEREPRPEGDLGDFQVGRTQLRYRTPSPSTVRWWATAHGSDVRRPTRSSGPDVSGAGVPVPQGGDLRRGQAQAGEDLVGVLALAPRRAVQSARGPAQARAGRRLDDPPGGREGAAGLIVVVGDGFGRGEHRGDAGVDPGERVDPL